jgi:transcriptional regulator with GAF, ATPase, and Fis domain
MEAELFGYAKGAFTGAYQAKKGKFEFADQGTLFLDEIGDFPLSLQPKLLRFLEDQLIERVGSISSKKVDVRLIAATNRDIETEVTEKNFREDLYHRLKVFTIKLPPLRERGEDKVVLAQYLFKKIKGERDWACKGFTREALDAIRHHAWPGNVREMINRIRRAMVVQDVYINPEDLELSTTETVTQTPRLKGIATALKKRTIESALREHHSNVSRTAKSLGISRSYLHLLIKQLHIQVAR